MPKIEYEFLLDDVAWDFGVSPPNDPKKFYEALSEYNADLGDPVSEEVLYSLDFSEVTIVFDYVEQKGGDWVNTKKSVHLKSSQENFNELELLYLLHHEVRLLFQDYDKSYLEGLNLIGSGEQVSYELLLGS